MALTTSEQRIYDRLQYKQLAYRHARTAKPPESPKEEKVVASQDAAELTQLKKMTDAVVKAMEDRPEPPVVNVTVAEPKKSDSPPTSPRRWVFKHKYDYHGNLTETTATAD